MRWPWSRTDDHEHANTLWSAEQRVAEVVDRGHRVAQSLEDRLARNHFADLMRQTMTGERT